MTIMSILPIAGMLVLRDMVHRPRKRGNVAARSDYHSVFSIWENVSPLTLRNRARRNLDPQWILTHCVAREHAPPPLRVHSGAVQ
jgi:hypothetical protein